MIDREKTQKILRGTVLTLGIALVLGYTLFATRDYLRGPAIIISEPVNGSTFTTPDVTVIGQALRIKELTFNGRSLLMDKEGNFKETLLLIPGYNHALFLAEDKFGRSTQTPLELIYIK